ncbi:PREDICTED: uncharacterized protein LOC109168066 [Ipomoea nil]|uniref:uncharacterized protein LOC109168066 n=1 Tax=Ipomoea nil TaxID=35883 RepID=UPI000901A4D8|nr:PREDICTED: uncharacterized protein LOC109168066 [Ipomoea nil]
MEGRTKSPGRTLLTALPFSSEIMSYKVPGDFKFPEQASFDGSGDPREHLLSYQAKMQVFGVQDPVMCRAFLPTLKGPAQRWLVALPPGSICNFEELADRFMSHYAANIKPQKDLTHLVDVHQEEGESLKTYLARWQKEIQSIEEVEDQTALTFFTESLRSGQLYRDLRANRPATYEEAIHMANKRANTEQAMKHKRQREVGGSASGKRTRAETKERCPKAPRRPEARRRYDKPVVHPYSPIPQHLVHEVQAVAPPPPPQLRSAWRTKNQVRYLSTIVTNLICIIEPSQALRTVRTSALAKREKKGDFFRGKSPANFSGAGEFQTANLNR